VYAHSCDSRANFVAYQYDPFYGEAVRLREKRLRVIKHRIATTNHGSGGSSIESVGNKNDEVKHHIKDYA
jgi:hypothetical protein